MRWPSETDEPDWGVRMAARVGTLKPVGFFWALMSWGITSLTGPSWGGDLPSAVLPITTNALLLVLVVGERFLRGGRVDGPADGLWRAGLALAGLLTLVGLALSGVGLTLIATQGGTQGAPG
ncbi:MAG: hypothetical protein H6742_09615 [Alphaproteobacteria bacterium]|nr:hypothetical protein [Alphaproteobacteria bacterium]